MTPTLVAPLPDTLAKAAGELALFTKVAAAVRTLEADPHVTHVVVSPNGEIVVMGDDFTAVALRLVA